MNDTQRRHYERGARVDIYMNANAADFPAGTRGARAAAELRTELAKLSTLDVAKAASAGTRQQTSAGRRELRASLRAQLAAIRHTADIIGRDHPEVRGRFPRTRADNSDQTLVAVARSFAETATPLKPLFIEYELPADFIERLREDADGLEAQITRQTEGRGTGVNTNANIRDGVVRVDEVVGRLDVILRNKYRNDPARLAEWLRASHLEHAPRSKRGGDDEPETSVKSPATTVKQ